MAGYRPSDASVCSSSAAREAIAALLRQVQESLAAEYTLKLPFRGRLEVIPLGVDTQVFKPGDREEARVRLGLPLHKLILLSLGRFSDQYKMDLEPLLEVFRQLHHACRREILLVLAGGDSERYSVRVQELAKELGLERDVQVLTNLPAVLPPLLYEAADLFVSVSDNVQEMFGQTPVEAMAAGLPVVVSDWDGYRETVIHGETGFRVPTVWGRCDADLCALSPLSPTMQEHALLAQSVAVDCGKLFEFLKLLVDDDALRKRMGEAARRRAIAEYCWSAVLRRYESLWAELADQAHSLPEAPERQLGFLRPDFTGAFGHFATRLLTPEARLRLTHLGAQAVRGRAPLRINPNLALYFNTVSLRQILALLLVAQRFRRPFRVGTALKVLCGRHALSEPAGLRHILWLIKHGLVSLIDE
jgi:glycosyltransferase involved in cell wall biosynthesis